MNRISYLIQISAYYCVWFSCTWFAAGDKAFIGMLISTILILIQLLWHINHNKNCYGLWLLIAILTLVGPLTDSLFMWCHYIIFMSNSFKPYFAPTWIIAIWFSFAILFCSTMSYLLDHYLLLGILSFLGFSIAYALGAKMGAAILPLGYVTCLWIGLTWSLLLPMCISIYKRMLN